MLRHWSCSECSQGTVLGEALMILGGFGYSVQNHQTQRQREWGPNLVLPLTGYADFRRSHLTSFSGPYMCKGDNNRENYAK